MIRENNGWSLNSQAPKLAQGINPGQLWHRDVDHQQVRLQSAGALNKCESVGHFAHNFVVGCEILLHCIEHLCKIVSNYDAYPSNRFVISNVYFGQSVQVDRWISAPEAIQFFGRLFSAYPCCDARRNGPPGPRNDTIVLSELCHQEVQLIGIPRGFNIHCLACDRGPVPCHCSRGVGTKTGRCKCSDQGPHGSAGGTKEAQGQTAAGKLRGEVSQADYAQANADFDDEIEGIAQQLHAVRSQRGALDAFIRFSKLMLTDCQPRGHERTLTKGYVFKLFSSETVLHTTKTRSF